MGTTRLRSLRRGLQGKWLSCVSRFNELDGLALHRESELVTILVVRLTTLSKDATMPRTLPFDVAKDSLRELGEGMVPGEELVLRSPGAPLAIVTRPPRTSWPCQPGSAKDRKHWMAPGFGAPLDDFNEYME
jgi:hypothetical protein